MRNAFIATQRSKLSYRTVKQFEYEECTRKRRGEKLGFDKGGGRGKKGLPKAKIVAKIPKNSGDAGNRTQDHLYIAAMLKRYYTTAYVSRTYRCEGRSEH